MQPMLNIALRAARSASELIFRSIERLDTIKVDEKDAKDYVSEVDRAAEQKIIDALRKAYPTHGILGEETGLHKGSGEGEDYLWIIDPLDGTTNFLRGVPHFAVSIACKYRGRLEHAVVLDPVRQEEFTASRGRGAQLNGRRLRVSGRTSLEGALLGTGFPFRDNRWTTWTTTWACSAAWLARLPVSAVQALPAWIWPMWLQVVSTHSGSRACPSGTWLQAHC